MFLLCLDIDPHDSTPIQQYTSHASDLDGAIRQGAELLIRHGLDGSALYIRSEGNRLAELTLRDDLASIDCERVTDSFQSQAGYPVAIVETHRLWFDGPRMLSRLLTD
jgi:hypothetical protein